MFKGELRLNFFLSTHMEKSSNFKQLLDHVINVLRNASKRGTIIYVCLSKVRLLLSCARKRFDDGMFTKHLNVLRVRKVKKGRVTLD